MASYNWTLSIKQMIVLINIKRTNWPKEFFRQVSSECGCGAGAITEILRKLGAIVVSVDIAGLDVCKDNVGEKRIKMVL